MAAGHAIPRSVRDALRLRDEYKNYDDAGGPLAFVDATATFVAELAAARRVVADSIDHQSESVAARDAFSQSEL